ncbi:MAG: cyclic nucleotide-binding domain-containing protein [Rhodospirillales bacterium]
MAETSENNGAAADDSAFEGDSAAEGVGAPEGVGADNDKAKPGAGSGGFTRRVFNKGETLAKEGERGDCAFVIKRGKVEIRKGARTPNPRILNTLGPGNVVAEFALFDGLPHSADVIATEETEVVALSRKEFEARVREMDPVLRTAVMGLVTKARHMVTLASNEGADSQWRSTPG